MRSDADATIDHQIGAAIRALRGERDWSLEDLAERSGVSRSTLSRIENAEVSGTAITLNAICSAFGITVSRLLSWVDSGFQPLLAKGEQRVWSDPKTGFMRRIVSPPSADLTGEVVEGRMPAGAEISYDRPPRPGLEHHVVLLEGDLEITVDGVTHKLQPGDCLRYRLVNSTRFRTSPGKAARYLIFLV